LRQQQEVLQFKGMPSLEDSSVRLLRTSQDRLLLHWGYRNKSTSPPWYYTSSCSVHLYISPSRLL